ncbi:sce7725 family protein [Pseudomonas kurunegalensis]|uniref:sce7725 family protein n=1 Tax=Pseudomonas kurunegalensis TaxID=485880 RepID=UPI0035563693
MYYPILRGKQFELIALRELAERLNPESVTPVIEPVRNNLKPLITTIDCLHSKGITPIIVTNPSLGDFARSQTDLSQELQSLAKDKFTPCIKVSTKHKATDETLRKINGETALYIEGSADKSFIALSNDAKLTLINTDKLPTNALSQFKNIVVYKNSFNKQVRNADYEELSFYSNAHIEFNNYKNAVGFGDFTILSEDYIESGGPAYVVTIHLSYIDDEEFDSMFVRHFSSFDDESPTNPGGKFSDALSKLITYVSDNPKKFYQSTGLDGLLDLGTKPFPGLGVVKKLSLKHHIETLSDFIEGQ